MNRKTTLSTLLMAAFLATACGGGANGEVAEDHEGMDGDMAEMAETAETAAAGGGAAMAMGGAEGCFLARGTLAEAQERPSPLMSVSMDGGLLCWGAPSANGREIMGDLVPFDAPWRAGANEATALHLTQATTIGGVALEPGSYSLYAIPGASEWTFVLNSNAERWGIPIDESVQSSDVGRFTATPEATDSMVETLTYQVDGGEIVMEWENTRLRIPVGM